MNQEQYERDLTAVRNDCTGRGTLVNDVGETCALGAMGLAAGFSKKKLRNLQLYQVIYDAYGLAAREGDAVFNINDNSDTIIARRRNVANVLHRLAKLYNLDVKPMGYESMP